MAEQSTEMPAWYDQERHVHNGRGVYERGTGLALAEDGLPVAGIIRAQRLAAAEKTTDPLGLVSDDLIASEGRAQKLAADLAADAAVAAAKPAGNRKNKQEAADAE